ncbi:MAG TPA: ankyrin repeat domain-containing protein [bacterium]|nr:ankyrin repeat domain-containing protein [bacterium]
MYILYEHVLLGDNKALKQALENKVEPVDNQMERSGTTALYQACQDCNLTAIELLLQHGASMYIQNWFKSTCAWVLLMQADNAKDVQHENNYIRCFQALLAHERQHPPKQSKASILDIKDGFGKPISELIERKLSLDEPHPIYHRLSSVLQDHIHERDDSSKSSGSILRHREKSNNNSKPTALTSSSSQQKKEEEERRDGET